jgi:hypothetical protein
MSSTIEAVNAKRPWTFFVYIAADNNLNPEADLNIAQMVRESSSSNVYIVVHLNIKRMGENKKTQKLLIKNGTISQIGATTAEDSGSGKTLLNALEWAITEYPSDHLLVDIWNHGSGPLNRSMYHHRGVCYDDSTGNFMTDLDYKKAFDVIVNQYRGGKKIDIIAFDACLMANLEVAFTLQNYANYIVSSQQTVPGPGYNYTDVLSIFDLKNPDAATLARWLVTSYNRYYKSSGESYTLSCIDASKLNAVVATTNTIAQTLTALLKTDRSGALARTITASTLPSVCPHFDEPTYIDLYTFYSNLYTRINQMGLNTTQASKLKTMIRSGMTAIAQAIMLTMHSPDFTKAKGVSIYFVDLEEGIQGSYDNLHWSKVNPAWLNFLYEYASVA